MRSQIITNLFLLFLVIALALFLFGNNEDKNKVIKLSKISADQIEQISIYHHQREILLNKIEQQWHLIKPVDIYANQFRIKTLLNLLSTTSHSQYQTDSLDLEKYGLDKPDTYIIFNDTKIYFGIVNPINNLRYVKIDNELHLIDDHYYPLLSSQMGTLVARELLPAEKPVSKLVLPEQTFTRDTNNKWQSTTKISIDAIVETIYQWQHKQAFAVHDFVQRKSLGEIQVYFKNDKTPVLFNITDVDPWLIIARPELKLEYHFNLEDYNSLLKPDTFKDSDKNSQNNLDKQTLQVSPDEFIETIQSQ